MLIARLRELEQKGFLTRTLYPEIPPRVEYALTAKGRTLKPIIDAMEAWGEAQGETSSPQPRRRRTTATAS
jgi:DNA-binding HxlR family transcriptional regulator